VKTISTPEPKHRCLLPGHLPGLPSSRSDRHYESVGTVVECEDCGQHWRSEPWPRVDYGHQMVGNRWIPVRRPRLLCSDCLHPLGRRHTLRRWLRWCQPTVAGGRYGPIDVGGKR
jgi:hypothetical protein